MRLNSAHSCNTFVISIRHQVLFSRRSNYPLDGPRHSKIRDQHLIRFIRVSLKYILLKSQIPKPEIASYLTNLD